VADYTVCNGQTITNAVALAAGGDEFNVVVDVNGTVWAVGENGADEQGGAPGNYNNGDHFPATAISGVSNVVSVAAGTMHVLALRADGAVFAWGSDSDQNSYPWGQLGVGGLASGQTSTPTQSWVSVPVVAIAAGAYHSVALDASGNVWVWGRGSEGEIGNGDTASVNVPTMLTTISNVIAIAAGYSHTVALTADKTCWTWGDNTYGELGRTGDVTVPLPVNGLSNVAAIAAGNNFTLAVSNGWVYGFGDNSSQELGPYSATSSNGTPLQIPGISNVVLVSAPRPDPDARGGQHVVAMTVDGGTNHFWGWGDNTSGEVGNGNTTTPQSWPTQVQFYTRCQRCVPLGTGGVFTAQMDGALYLYFNTDQSQFYNAAGSYTAVVNGVQFTVPGNNNHGSGTFAGTVTNGQVCTYSATGTCYWYIGNTNSVADANGNGPSGPWDCNDFTVINKTNAVCPMWQCYSLVGKIQ
jgi:alpha-tubulin suppressor-like RCC1 family protein